MRNLAGRLAAVSLASLAIAIQAAPARAQDRQAQENAGSDTQESRPAPAAEAEIVVTGSRIARRDYIAASPILTTAPEQIAAAGTATVDNFLRQLPQFQPGQGDFSNNSAGGTIGQATLNLRGLGAQRNLVLLDGRRLQPGNPDGVIDINTIPTLALGNIEVISGGASATYGSDAVAGVVNFKVRTDLNGLEVNAQNSISGRGDGATRQIGVAYGKRFSRGSILLSGEYVDRSSISYQDRTFFRNQVPSGFIPQGLMVPDGTNLPSQAAVNAVFASYGVTATVSRTSLFGFNDDGTIFNRATNPYNYRGSSTGPYINTSSGFGYNGICGRPFGCKR